MLQILRFKFGTIKQFKLPDLGEKIKEATLVKWYVKEGDKVKEFDTIADVSTDKMFTQIPCLYTGTIHKRFHKESELCQIGELFLEIDCEDYKTQKIDISPSQIKTQEPIITKLPSKIQQLQRIAPSARIRALQRNLDLSTIKGTGIYGTVTKYDVINHKEHTRQEQPNNNIKISQQKQMTNQQKEIYKNVTISKQIPHLYLDEEVDLTQINNLLAGSNYRDYTGIFIKTISQSLLKFPILNSSYYGQNKYEILNNRQHNMRIYLENSIDHYVQDVQNLSIKQIEEQISKLYQQIIFYRSSNTQQQQETISVYNFGQQQGTFYSPLIKSPQIIAIGIGRQQLVPRLFGSGMKPRNIVNVSIGADHRVVDGATVTRFTQQWKKYLEQPELMILNLK
ncbi:hypothetical protein pb186bvf_016461 [Paramecium bursaria]